MASHVRANLWLLGLTLVLGSGFYPLLLWGYGQACFPTQAEGSLLIGPDGKPVGSRLIAQPFSSPLYFQPRPSAVSYKADASGASNWSASNYLLRDRVARQLGPVLRYRRGPHQGALVANDVEAWFKATPNLVAEWAAQHEGVAKAWVSADDKHQEAVKQWQASHPAEVAAWRTAHPEVADPSPTDLAQVFFTSNSQAFHTAWPKLTEDPTWTIAAVFFDRWLAEHPDAAAQLETVPADLVMASGSGLDPHITLRNAQDYQLDRVAQAWSEKRHEDPARVRQRITALLEEKAAAPLGGWVGERLVNVLEVNLALRERLEPQAGARQ